MPPSLASQRRVGEFEEGSLRKVLGADAVCAGVATEAHSAVYNDFPRPALPFDDAGEGDLEAFELVAPGDEVLGGFVVHTAGLHVGLAGVLGCAPVDAAGAWEGAFGG